MAEELDGEQEDRRDSIKVGGRKKLAKLRILSHHGDTTVEWDVERARAGDPEAADAVREAERIFEEQRAKGATAFRVEPGRSARKLETFDRTAEQIVMVPRIAGGAD